MPTSGAPTGKGASTPSCEGTGLPTPPAPPMLPSGQGAFLDFSPPSSVLSHRLMAMSVGDTCAPCPLGLNLPPTAHAQACGPVSVVFLEAAAP